MWAFIKMILPGNAKGPTLASTTCRKAKPRGTTTWKEAPLRGITVSIASLVVALAFSSTAFSAEPHGPMRDGNNCFYNSPTWGGPNAGMFGYWAKCTGPAAAQRAQRRLARRQRDPHADR